MTRNWEKCATCGRQQVGVMSGLELMKHKLRRQGSRIWCPDPRFELRDVDVATIEAITDSLPVVAIEKEVEAQRDVLRGFSQNARRRIDHHRAMMRRFRKRGYVFGVGYHERQIARLKGVSR